MQSHVLASEILLYCDGGCRGNPGPGGWGVWGHFNQECWEKWGGVRLTTNNQMELTAAIRALQMTPPQSKVLIRTDSQYVVKGVHEWRSGWEAKAWKGVKNMELWQALLMEVDQRTVTFEWVRGHAGNSGNEHADRLAQAGIDLLSITPHSVCEAERRSPSKSDSSSLVEIL